MTTCLLTIDFREGFYDDTVIVFDNEKEVIRKANVTSKTMTGFAGSASLQLESGKHNLRVLLQEKEVNIELTIEINSPLFLGLNYKPQKGLEYQLQGEPFKYM